MQHPPSQNARLQDIADMYADTEFVKQAQNVTGSPDAWRARVASNFLRDHRHQLITYMDRYPDADNANVLKEYQSERNNLRSHQVPSGQHPDVNCRKCDGSGWREVGFNAQSDEYQGQGEMTRCECFAFRPPVAEQYRVDA